MTSQKAVLVLLRARSQGLRIAWGTKNDLLRNILIGVAGSLVATVISTSLYAFWTSIENPSGTIAAPQAGSVVSDFGIVEGRVFEPDSFVVAIIKPTAVDQYFVQNVPTLAVPGKPFALRVRYGGRDRYDVFVVITLDARLLAVGEIDQIPRQDSFGRPVHLLGPVQVAHE